MRKGALVTLFSTRYGMSLRARAPVIDFQQKVLSFVEEGSLFVHRQIRLTAERIENVLQKKKNSVCVPR